MRVESPASRARSDRAVRQIQFLRNRYTNEAYKTIEINPQDELAIGSGITESRWCIKDDSTVAPVHCCVMLDQDGQNYWFTALDTEYGSYVRIPNTGRLCGLSVGTVVKVGLHVIKFESEDEETSTWAVKFGQKNTSLTVGKEKEILIGRLKKCSIGSIAGSDDTTGDEYLSGEHARLVYDQNRHTYTMHDGTKKKPSTNGCWVKLGTRTVLMAAGTQVNIGKDTYITLA